MPAKKPPGSGRTSRLLGAGLRTLGRSVVSKLPIGDENRRKAQYWADVGADWAKTLGELRGAAMKLGQMASQYADVLPPALAEQLGKLQNQADPLPFAELRPVLDAAWDPDSRAQVASIEPQALASASIGQVHRAVLVDGRRVVVKIRYPDVERAVDADVRALRKLISVSRVLPVDDAAIDRVLEEVRLRFNEETDYRCELQHLIDLRRDAATDGVLYPEPVTVLCRDNVLVTTEVSGAAVAVATGWSQEVRDLIGRRVVQWLLHQFFTAHAVHADPHPGNFAFRDSGEFIVYDFGCVKRVPEAIVDTVQAMLLQLLDRDWRGFHDNQIRLGAIRPQVRFEEVAGLYQSMVEAALDPLLDGEFDFAAADYIENIRAVARKNLTLGLKFNPVQDLAFVARALSGLYWLLRSLRCRVDIAALLQTYKHEKSETSP